MNRSVSSIYLVEKRDEVDEAMGYTSKSASKSKTKTKINDDDLVNMS